MYYFDTAILSTIIYAAQIWALEQGDIIEMAQTHFIRKLLAIYPPRSANYFLRLETGRVHTQYRLLSLAVKFHGKLIKMQEVRLPKIIYEEQIHLNKTGKSYKEDKNWLKLYEKILNHYGVSVEEMNKLHYTRNRTAITGFFKKVETILKNQDLKKAEESNTYRYYKYPFISHNAPSYTYSLWPIYLKRLNAALRNKSEWIMIGKNKIIQLYKYESCPLCNIMEPYSVYHILINCKLLTPYRKKGNFCSTQIYPEDEYVLSFTSLSLPQIKEIHNLLYIHISQIDLTR